MSNPPHGGGSHDHGGLGHAVPMRILLGTWAALVVLTVVTVGATYVDLGEMNIFLAMGIAVVKSTFVALYFMHLRWDKPFHSIVFVSAALFVMLFISLALLDTTQYAGEKIPGYAPDIQAAAPAAGTAEAGTAEAGTAEGGTAEGATAAGTTEAATAAGTTAGGPEETAATGAEPVADEAAPPAGH